MKILFDCTSCDVCGKTIDPVVELEPEHLRSYSVSKMHVCQTCLEQALMELQKVTGTEEDKS